MLCMFYTKDGSVLADVILSLLYSMYCWILLYQESVPCIYTYVYAKTCDYIHKNKPKTERKTIILNKFKSLPSGLSRVFIYKIS